MGAPCHSPDDFHQSSPLPFPNLPRSMSEAGRYKGACRGAARSPGAGIRPAWRGLGTSRLGRPTLKNPKDFFEAISRHEKQGHQLKPAQIYQVQAVLGQPDAFSDEITGSATQSRVDTGASTT